MTVHRFFVPPQAAIADRFPLPALIEHQVRRVLRLRDGDPLVLLTGDGSELACRLEGTDCVVETRRAAVGEPAHRLTVVQAVLKGDALETVVGQGTEIGIAAFRLVVAERSVVRELPPRRLERLRAIAREAAEQSERGIVPRVSEPIPLAEALEPGAVLLAERSHGSRLSDLAPPSAVVVGPEGGFTPAELAAAEAAGVPFATLGRRILRSETVAVAAAAVVLSRTGDFA
jgi:16S rRNA (uracil1498-N3)-methyltransferase